jgi:hypothetical protein
MNLKIIPKYDDWLIIFTKLKEVGYITNSLTQQKKKKKKWWVSDRARKSGSIISSHRSPIIL